MLKVKVYKVYPKDNYTMWYLVEAPCKYIAKWCGTAIINRTYTSGYTAKDMKVERWAGASKEEENVY